MTTITIIYRVESDEEFEKVNPLRLGHHGLRAVAVSIGDLLEWKEQATKLLEAHNLTPPALQP
jgi:hypothetical protein